MPENTKLIDIYICKVETSVANRDAFHNKTLDPREWEFMLGVTPKWLATVLSPDEWAKEKAQNLNRHIALRFHCNSDNIMETNMPIEIYSPN